jgi:hypothetical protein
MKRKIQNLNTLGFILQKFTIVLVFLFGGFCCESLGFEIKHLAQQKSALQASSNPDLTPDPKVDEQLFMIRQLEHLYSQWPRNFGDPKNVAKDLARVRHQLVRGEEYAKEKMMDKRLIDMYEESIKLIDNYSVFLKNINLIDGDFYDKKTSEDRSNLIEKTAEGLGAMTAVGFEPMSASAILVGMLIRSGIESDNRNKKHEREKEFEIQKET